MILVRYLGTPSLLIFLFRRKGVEDPLRGDRGVPLLGVVSQDAGSELRSASVESNWCGVGFWYNCGRSRTAKDQASVCTSVAGHSGLPSKVSSSVSSSKSSRPKSFAVSIAAEGALSSAILCGRCCNMHSGHSCNRSCRLWMRERVVCAPA